MLTIARHTRTAAAGCCAALTTLAAHGAKANWTANYLSASQYSAAWTFVPDFDQRRALLPNTGSMYCVPTSAMNWIAYIARHGYPIIAPPGDHHFLTWLQPQWYNPVTSWIDLLGQFMQTDENNGTSGSSGVAGLKMWLPPAGFVIYRYRIVENGWFTPRFDDIALWTLNKVPVLPVVGWTKVEGGELVRTGGHVVSLTNVARSGSSREIGFRDPADESAILFTQSNPVTREFDIQPTAVVYKGLPRALDKVVGYGSGYIDAYWAILPLGGLTSADDGINLIAFKPNKFSWDQSQALQNIAMPTGAGTLKGLKFIPGSPAYAVATQSALGPSTIWKVDQFTGEAMEIVRPAAGVSRMVFGRNRQLYYLDAAGAIHCVDIDRDPPAETVVVAPPEPVQALAYSDVTDQLLALSATDGMILLYGEDLAPAGSIMLPGPPTAPLLEEAGEAEAPAMPLGANAFIAVSPEDGAIFYTSDASTEITRLFFDAAGTMMTESIGAGMLTRPTSLVVGDGDTVFVNAAGTMKVFTPSAAGGWSEDPTHPLAGWDVGALVDIPYSRMNGDRAAERLPDQFHVLPTDFGGGTVVEDCLYDLDGDGGVGPADLFQLLGSWGAPFGPSEIFGVLGSWGLCPTTP